MMKKHKRNNATNRSLKPKKIDAHRKTKASGSGRENATRMEKSKEASSRKVNRGPEAKQLTRPDPRIEQLKRDWDSIPGLERASRIRGILKDTKISQRALARHLGCNEKTIRDHLRKLDHLEQANHEKEECA